MVDQMKRMIVKNGKPVKASQPQSDHGAKQTQTSNDTKANATVTFEACHVDSCPHYQKGDEFHVSGHAVYLPYKKGEKFSTNINVEFPVEGTPCKTLLAEITKTIVQYERASLITDQVISCGPCQGNITLKHKQSDELAIVQAYEQSSEEINRNSTVIQNFSIFETMDDSKHKKFIELFQMKQYAPGDCIIKRGEPNENLYIILSGLVDVLDERNEKIVELNSGEVFGEMSLIRWHAATATVCAAIPTEVLIIDGQSFLEPLADYPNLRIYLAKLISRRLFHSCNIDFVKALSQPLGKIEDDSVLTLVKSLHYGGETGVLNLFLPKGSGQLVFREGKLVGAEYAGKKGKTAFFAMLGPAKGKYEFKSGLLGDQMRLPEMGMFMELLLEGMPAVRNRESKESRKYSRNKANAVPVTAH